MLLTMRGPQRAEASRALMDGRLSVAQAAYVLGRSHWRNRRLLARARADAPLAPSIARGWEPANPSDDRLWRRVLKVVREPYAGVNDRHLQELLTR